MSIALSEAKSRIIVALDVPNKEQALDLVDKLKDEVGMFKVGMELYNAEGASIVQEIQKRGSKVFVDLKFHDIPNTVGQAARIITQKGADMFTVHACGGSRMLAAAAENKNAAAAEMHSPAPIALAVTVLTSTSQEEFEQEMGFNKPIVEQVVHLAQLAERSGMDGVVASPKEIKAIREVCGPDFLIVTPGIRPLWAAANDQSRITTPKDAINAGANYLVIGRPIVAQPDPAAAARRIAAEIAEV